MLLQGYRDETKSQSPCQETAGMSCPKKKVGRGLYEAERAGCSHLLSCQGGLEQASPAQVTCKPLSNTIIVKN